MPLHGLNFYSQCLTIIADELSAAPTPTRTAIELLFVIATATTDTKKNANIAGIIDKHRRQVFGCIGFTLMMSLGVYYIYRFRKLHE